MRAERMEERLARLNLVSERVFGDAAEAGAEEAEELVKAAGIDPARLKDSLFEKFEQLSEEYLRAGRPLPPLLDKALEDLGPGRETRGGRSPLGRGARLHVQRLLAEIGDLRNRLAANHTLAFRAAYRNRKDLSARDKQTLDAIAEDLRRTAHE